MFAGPPVGHGERSQGVPNIEQDFEEELFALIGGIELQHPYLIAHHFGAFVRLPIDGLQVVEDALAGTDVHVDTGIITNPLGTFGTKYVDFGGIALPESATANTCSTRVGLTSTAAAAPPPRTAAKAARGSAV